MAVISELRWNGKVFQREDDGPAQVRERSPVGIPSELV